MRLDAEILRVRRLLGIIPSAEARHRERKRQGIVLRPRREPDTVEKVLEDFERGGVLARGAGVSAREKEGGDP